MNIRFIVRILSVLLWVLAAFMLLPLIIAFYYSETAVIPVFLKTSALMSVIAGFGYYYGKRSSKQYFSVKDGFLFVTLSWIFAGFFGALPFILSGSIPHLADAFFESMSGFTTTGASILTDIEALPKSILFWRSLTHWLGGMGIVVLMVAIMQFIGFGGLHLLKAESPGPTVDKITPRITDMAKILWLAYIVLTLIEILLLKIGGMDLFEASTHAFGTMATGGFSPKSASVGHYSSPFIHWVITVFMLLAGINFMLYYKLVSGKLKDILRNTELKAYLLVFVAATAVIIFSLYNKVYAGFWESARYASFQSASILTTTGFSTADFDVWPALAKAVLLSLMFVGGCSGSTGGGIKVIRLVLLFKLAVNEMKHMLHSHGVFNMKINNRTVKKDIMYPVSAFFLLYIMSLLAITLIVASGGNGITTSFTSALATLGNIGPGFSKIGPSLNYAFYDDYIKWVLSFAMMAGRLELYTVFVVFTPLFWKK